MLLGHLGLGDQAVVTAESADVLQLWGRPAKFSGPSFCQLQDWSSMKLSISFSFGKIYKYISSTILKITSIV
jgi:hypothetical protein